MFGEGQTDRWGPAVVGSRGGATLLPGPIEEALLLVRDAGAAVDGRIHLVPSEARMSPLARLPLSSDLYFRYFFNEHGDPHFWQFRGGEDVGHLEHEMAIPVLRRLGRAKHVNLRPISGLSAMLLVVSGLGGPLGSGVVSVSQSHGGHFATGSVIGRLGRTPLPVDVVDGHVDRDQLAAHLAGGTVGLVYIDLQNTLVELAVDEVVRTVRDVSPTTWVHVDSSHTLGLILGGAHANPLELGAGSFGGSTHKSFPGPQKGVVFTDDDDAADRLRAAQFDLISSHHFAETLALGLAAAEFEHFGPAYATATIANAQTLAAALARRGFDVAGAAPQHTATHQVWMRAGTQEEVTRIGTALQRAGISVNVQDDLPGLPGAVFRLGVNETTFEGAGAVAMELVADAFREARDGAPVTPAAKIRATFGAPHHVPAEVVTDLLERHA